MAEEKQSHVLKMQKETMKKAYIDYLWAGIFLSVLALAVVIAAVFTNEVSFTADKILYAVLLVLCILALFVYMGLRRYLVYARFNKIKSSVEKNVIITCKKVSFIFKPVRRHSGSIICIIFTDESGKKYYNVTKEIPDSEKKKLKAKLLNSKIALTCYGDTECVRSFRAVTEEK
ncbi:MAG: Na+/H+ antiporter NhaA [Ruminococcaceae bacterium]|nr:Na+/H+ antiporter NhaA [Oscillospiraceae bacterium]